MGDDVEPISNVVHLHFLRLFLHSSRAEADGEQETVQSPENPYRL